ncbi:MAG: hypothetical protein J1E60_06485 [Christensenellaceae bacterium]|nr:hypothetical protein [Christensenellaceae bacterium]
MRTDINKYVDFPTSLGSDDYEKRGLNDCEIRYKPYNERVHNGKGAVNHE